MCGVPGIIHVACSFSCPRICIRVKNSLRVIGVSFFVIQSCSLVGLLLFRPAVLQTFTHQHTHTHTPPSSEEMRKVCYQSFKGGFKNIITKTMVTLAQCEEMRHSLHTDSPLHLSSFI